jgi:hypothetical protein
VPWWWVEPGPFFFVFFDFDVPAFFPFFSVFEPPCGLEEGDATGANGDGAPLPETWFES